MLRSTGELTITLKLYTTCNAFCEHLTEYERFFKSYFLSQLYSMYMYDNKLTYKSCVGARAQGFFMRIVVPVATTFYKPIVCHDDVMIFPSMS